MFRIVSLVLLASISAAPRASAELIEFTVRVSADFEFQVVEGGPLAQALIDAGITPPSGFVPFRALGDITFTLDDTGAPTGGAIPFTSVRGTFEGVSPSPALFLPFTLSPEVEFYGSPLSELTNIVRQDGQIVSGDVENLTMDFTLVPQAPNPLAGVNFFTDGGLSFSAKGVSVPFGPGTFLSLTGDDRFNVYMGPDPDPDTIDPSQLAVIGRNRTLTVVPEPASLALMAGGLGMVGFAVAVGRRTRGRLKSLRPVPLDSDHDAFP
ncbi:PEP-CTERM sorting domain-containing protein [Tautonia rosea]|uniref:PEP-CTERM sorting domain-containing protein n=1 Tax=Tautonia rosea TaxID=2728037 RepID=UPI00147436EB|nr:PEP-CTERM sorting domain-containing protein [Tautonia rosea]